jgi:hypothetical protein
MSHVEILNQNIATLREWHVNDNVMIEETTKERTTSFGRVVDFRANCFGEICLDIALIVEQDCAEKKMLVHPRNSIYKLTKIKREPSQHYHKKS